MGDAANEWLLRRAQRGATSTSYEALLDRDAEWALSEGGRFFEGKSAVNEALRKIARRLDDLGIPYAVAGGMALFEHGFRRFTEDVDILVRHEDLKKIHLQLDGLGYTRPFAGAKNLRDTELGVRVEFLIAGQFPGDGKPKPIAFPDPEAVAFEQNGVKYIGLPTLIELKLASGMTSIERGKDLVDVHELIKNPRPTAGLLRAPAPVRAREICGGVALHEAGWEAVCPRLAPGVGYVRSKHHRRADLQAPRASGDAGSDEGQRCRLGIGKKAGTRTRVGLRASSPRTRRSPRGTTCTMSRELFDDAADDGD